MHLIQNLGHAATSQFSGFALVVSSTWNAVLVFPVIGSFSLFKRQPWFYQTRHLSFSKLFTDHWVHIRKTGTVRSSHMPRIVGDYREIWNPTVYIWSPRYSPLGRAFLESWHHRLGCLWGQRKPAYIVTWRCRPIKYSPHFQLNIFMK